MIPIEQIISVPLDLPKFEPDSWADFWRVWNEDAKIFKRHHPDANGNGQAEPGWKGFVWEITGNKDIPMFITTIKDYSDVFPKLRAQIDALPFTTRRIQFISNYRVIGEHRDGLYLTKDTIVGPTAPRIMFYDANTEPTFYYTKKRLDAKKYYQTLPEDTNSFAFDNDRTYHGAVYANRLKIMCSLVISDIDLPAWTELLQRSAEKYQSYCITHS